MSICLYCGKEEPNYKPSSNVDYVCSSCVIMLLDRTQEQLKELYKACREREYVGKEEAIELFLIDTQEEEDDGNKNNERSTNGSRISRDIGLKKELHRKFKKTRFAVL